MPLNPSTLKGQIQTLLNTLKGEINQKKAIEEFAQKLSLAIDSYLRGAEVTGIDSKGGPIKGKLQ